MTALLLAWDCRILPQAAPLRSPPSRTQDCKKCLFFREKRDSVPLQLNLNSESFAMAAKKAPAAAKSAAKSPKAAAPAKAAAQPTVTLKHLAAAIAEDQELSKKQAESILSDMVTMITKHLKKGERIRIVGLGILQVRKRAARMGRNPATGEAIQIKASKKVAFRAAKELKEAV